MFFAAFAFVYLLWWYVCLAWLIWKACLQYVGASQRNHTQQFATATLVTLTSLASMRLSQTNICFGFVTVIIIVFSPVFSCFWYPFISLIYFLTSWFHSICLPRRLLPETAAALLIRRAVLNPVSVVGVFSHCQSYFFLRPMLISTAFPCCSAGACFCCRLAAAFIEMRAMTLFNFFLQILFSFTFLHGFLLLVMLRLPACRLSC